MYHMPYFPNCQHSFGVFSGCTERGLHMSHRVGIGCCVGSCTHVVLFSVIWILGKRY